MSQEGWDINHADQLEWLPWGERGARAKIFGSADGSVVALVEADAGYQGTPHEHAYAEFVSLIDGDVTNQGATMTAGDGYAAAAGSRHDQFEANAPARYLSIFKLCNPGEGRSRSAFCDNAGDGWGGRRRAIHRRRR